MRKPHGIFSIGTLQRFLATTLPHPAHGTETSRKLNVFLATSQPLLLPFCQYLSTQHRLACQFILPHSDPPVIVDLAKPSVERKDFTLSGFDGESTQFPYLAAPTRCHGSFTPKKSVSSASTSIGWQITWSSSSSITARNPCRFTT